MASTLTASSVSTAAHYASGGISMSGAYTASSNTNIYFQAYSTMNVNSMKIDNYLYADTLNFVGGVAAICTPLRSSTAAGMWVATRW